MGDKFRDNPANSDNLSRGLLLHRDGVRGLEQLAVVGSPEGRDATRVFTTRLRDGDGVHRASDLIADDTADSRVPKRRFAAAHGAGAAAAGRADQEPDRAGSTES